MNLCTKLMLLVTAATSACHCAAFRSTAAGVPRSLHKGVSSSRRRLVKDKWGAGQPSPFGIGSPNDDQSTASTALQMWSGDDELRGSDRIKACFPYILPLLDGDQFGYYIYDRIPPLGLLDDILLGPLLNIFHAVPFLGILFFLALTLGTRTATDMSRGVRFNAQQAALIDVVLVFPELIANGFAEEDPLPRSIAEPCSNFVYYLYMSMVIYSIYSNLRGKKPNQIPYISNFAELAVGPF